LTWKCTQNRSGCSDESLLYRLKYSAAPDRAGEILFAYQPMIELGAPVLRKKFVRREIALR
jgi:hypothetical protein